MEGEEEEEVREISAPSSYTNLIFLDPDDLGLLKFCHP